MAITITKKIVEVPSDIMFDIADIISQNDITNAVTGVDHENDTIFIELQYEKVERDAVREIENAIADYEDDSEEDDNEEKEA